MSRPHIFLIYLFLQSTNCLFARLLYFYSSVGETSKEAYAIDELHNLRYGCIRAAYGSGKTNVIPWAVFQTLVWTYEMLHLSSGPVMIFITRIGGDVALFRRMFEVWSASMLTAKQKKILIYFFLFLCSHRHQPSRLIQCDEEWKGV